MKRVSTWGLVLVMSVAAVSAGCARKSTFSAMPKNGEAQADAQVVQPGADLKQVTYEAANLAIGDPAVTADEFIDHTLVMRTEKFKNQGDQPVTIWLRPSLGTMHLWGLCSAGRAQYQADGSISDFRVTGARMISKDVLQGEWSAIEILAGESAEVDWVGGGAWSWIPGPYGAPAGSCNESNPQRGWAGFDLQAVFSDIIRVSVVGASESEATGPANFLDSQRVLQLSGSAQSVSQHWGDGT